MFSTLVPVACRTVRDTLDTTLGSPLFPFQGHFVPQALFPPRVDLHVGFWASSSVGR
ncbi:uncharacterized protein CCOS01_05807 [Colletotrichum costaricense]|uniref:Uncharacterized protein n=1 Tax=Colletotrichum costaricense TaxID=1209916 RepID=A0AAI9Z177_9PEZI|nr:uncharacterized protein CCOS01_05807 [Colletotrichum costaricense]KAK1530704.1 hypothetical protein CCOS01_05807 [Colletotrichum costaricense]